MDDMDAQAERQLQIESMAMAANAMKAAAITKGHSGVCDLCGEENERLMGASHFKSKGHRRIAEGIIDGICSPCRDRHKLP